MSTDTQLRTASEPTGPLTDHVKPDPYDLWIEREGIKRYVDFVFDDLKALELGDWERKGGSGAIITIPNKNLYNDCHVIEIRPGGHSEPEHHLYEVMIYVLTGRGATAIWQDDEKKKRTFEWHTGSHFAIPLNASYQFFNASGDQVARYLAVTNAPPMLRLFGDEGFIFDNPVRLKGRYSGDEEFFSGSGNLFNRRIWESNFIPNAPEMGLWDMSSRGAGGVNAMLEMGGNNIQSHISEFPIGTYKKAHRHGPGAHLLLLRGTGGYSLLWKEGEEPRRADWQEGAMVIVPEESCLHQHFNTGTTPARYLALRNGNMGLYPPAAGGSADAERSSRDGGWQIEYADEDPGRHEMFEAELAKNGAPCRMKAFVPSCKGEVGPTGERDT